MELSTNEEILLFSLKTVTQELRAEICHKDLKIQSLINEIQSLNAYSNSLAQAKYDINKESEKDKSIILSLKNEIEVLNVSVNTLLTELNKKDEDYIQEKKTKPETASKQELKQYDPEIWKQNLEISRKILEPAIICHFKARALTTEQAQEVWNLYKQGNLQSEIVQFMRAKGITLSQPIIHQIVNGKSYKNIIRG